MIYAIAFVGLLVLVNIGASTHLAILSERKESFLLAQNAQLTAALAEMAGEPRAARIVERQATTTDEVLVERTARTRPTPYGLRAR